MMVQIRSGIGRVIELPGAGHRRVEFTDESVRSENVQPYVIVFHCTGDIVVILRVMHGARDFSGQF